ncbi:hypothetical protein QYF36_015846 [Acer negundo]|nr:hypothetical protein QYF36_015846 [Acer negundo]
MLRFGSRVSVYSSFCGIMIGKSSIREIAPIMMVIIDISPLGRLSIWCISLSLHIAEVNVPVVGGHAGVTILPLFSQATPKSNSLGDEDIKALTKRT